MEDQAGRTSKRRKLDRDAIVDAAITRIEQRGLEDLSARKLARDLGCEAMSLYHHVDSMDALKDSIVERLLGSLSREQAGDPFEGLMREAEAYLALAESHPNSFQLIAGRRWKGERSGEVAARAVSRFRALGFDAEAALAKARTLGAYLNGAGVALAAWAIDPGAPSEIGGKVKEDLRLGLELIMRSLTKPG